MGRTFPDTETTPYNYVDDGTLPTTTTDGTFIRTDGTATTTDGTFTTTDETFFRTDGTVTTTDGTFIRTDGSFTTTDGTFFRTDGTATTTDETFIRTDGTATTTDATFTGTGGTVPNTGGIITTNDGSAMTTDETFTGTDETVFTTVGATTRIDGTVSTTDGDQLRSPTDKPPTLCVSHWTDFFDTDNPDTGDGDVEALKDIRESNTVCGDLVIGDVECRASVNGTLVDYREAGDVGVKCSKFTGLVCLNWLQNRGKTCHDYSVRFFCECGKTANHLRDVATLSNVGKSGKKVTEGKVKRHVCFISRGNYFTFPETVQNKSARSYLTENSNRSVGRVSCKLSVLDLPQHEL